MRKIVEFFFECTPRPVAFLLAGLLGGMTAPFVLVARWCRWPLRRLTLIGLDQRQRDELTELARLSDEHRSFKRVCTFKPKTLCCWEALIDAELKHTSCTKDLRARGISSWRLWFVS